MESSVSSKDCKRSLIWSHFTQIGSDNTNMIRSVCNQCKKQLNLFNKYLLLVTFETDNNYSIRFEMEKHYSHSTIRHDIMHDLH